MRAPPLLLALLLSGVLAGCARPPATAYFGGSPEVAGSGVGLGTDTAGEACTQQTRGGADGGFDIFCGTWTQPSGHVQKGGAADAGSLTALATTGPWRASMDARFICADPIPTTVVSNAPAVAMQCVRKVGGWPQVAIVAAIDGTAYFGDGIEPTVSVVQRGIGVASGRVQPSAAVALPRSSADALFAARLAAQSFSAGDIGQYEQLVLAGTNANLVENFVAAEKAYRAAIALQEKALGRNDANLAVPLMLLALQVSDQGRYAEANSLFARAAPLAPHAADATAVGQLLQYQALHDVNQHKYADALALLRRSDAAYAAVLPKEALTPRPSPRSPSQVLAASGSSTRSDPLPKDDIVLDPTEQRALIGVIETRRYSAIALRALHRDRESDQAIASAVDLASAHGMRQPKLTARLYRTAAANAGAEGEVGDAIDGLTRSSAAFSQAYPGTRPLAATEMLHAAQLHKGGNDAAALDLCQLASQQLQNLKAGIEAEILDPCLEVYAARAMQNAGQRQVLLAEMFAAAQLAQGSITGQQIAEATARLGESSRDPRVGVAIRRQQDAATTLADLLRLRDLIAAGHGTNAPPDLTPLPDPADLEMKINAAQSDLADANAALQEASPNFGQLVQQVVPASDVFGALMPDEAFAMITLGADNGWVFVLHDGQVDAARTGTSAARMTELVRNVRASIEPTTDTVPRFDTADAQTIYTDTLGRLEPALANTKSITVAPAGPLLSLPFAVLLTGPADPDKLAAAPWLLKRMDIAHVPAASNFVSLRKVAGTSRATQPWFGLGDFHPVTLAQAQRTFPGGTCADSAKLFAGLPPLPFARRELDAARALLGGSGNDEMLGPNFTAAAVQRTNLSNYRVLHFAAHALLPSELRCASEPAIVTSDPAGAPDASGALLTASEVLNLQLDADLVVLSACNSGGPGGSTGGESLSGLARSFFFAGARSMLVTHWSVNDQAAAFLVASTMKQLSAGKGVAAAMRASQLSLLDNAGTSHPFFWAPFAVIGESRGKIVTARAPQNLAGL